MFQVFLIIFWATIRLQGWGDAAQAEQASQFPTRGAVRAERMNPFPTKFVAAAAAIKLHLIRRKRHLPLKGKAMAMTYLRHVSGAKRTSMGKISRRPRNMSKHRTALLIILSPETPMVKVFESMP